MAFLYDDEGPFPMEFSGAFRTKRLETLVGGSAKLTFRDVPPGRYAVALVHDENGNGELDKNLLGMPKEGVGASNHHKRGRPSWEVSSFVLEADARVKVKLNYM